MQPFHRAIIGVKGLALTVLIAIPVTAAVAAESDHDTAGGSVTAALAHSTVAPAARVPEHCHGAGALIRTHGRIHQVSVLRGLRTYVHEAPGVFIKLCPRAAGGSDPAPQGS